MHKHLDVKPIAQDLADAIVKGREDPRIILLRGGVVKLKIAEIVPETEMRTTATIRSRLRKHLSAILALQGWKEVSPNIFSKCERAAKLS
jgi:hypothetical protein